MQPNDAHTKLNVPEAAALLRVSKSWLDKKRLDGGGPEYINLAAELFMTSRDLENWAARNKRCHTSDAA